VIKPLLTISDKERLSKLLASKCPALVAGRPIEVIVTYKRVEGIDAMFEAYEPASITNREIIFFKLSQGPSKDHLMTKRMTEVVSGESRQTQNQ
jgi:hypothetical protein